MKKNPAQQVPVHMELADGTHRVGELSVFTARGHERYQFRYDAAWTTLPGAFAIDPVLELIPDIPYTAQKLWGAFQDISPDRWGRLVQTRAQNRTLGESEFMLGVSDYMRMGALRLSSAEAPDVFLAPHTDIPRLLHLARLEEASQNIEKDRATAADLAAFLLPGSSLGGARPKAAVEDDGALWIAKFQSAFDTERAAPREAIMLELARLSGIETARYKILNAEGSSPILLVRRFDRKAGRRIPFASAMTMLERDENDGGSSGYPDLADAVTRFSSQPLRDRAELWRRMTFNAMMGNTDDHLRNHAFLRDEQGWHLAPAYDLNPSDLPFERRTHALSFDGEHFRPSLALCLSIADYFEIAPAEIRAFLARLRQTLVHWRQTARRIGMTPPEIGRLSVSFEHADNEKILRGTAE